MSAELDARVAPWRAALLRSAAVTPDDADELEAHLRDSVADLERAGLDGDEAFLIAVKRLGATDAVTAEFAREHGDRLWKQLVLPARGDGSSHPVGEMVAFAAVAVALIQVARLAAERSADPSWFTLNLGFLLLPVLAAYFVRMRRMTLRAVAPLAAGVAALALLVNLYPLRDGAAGSESFLGGSFTAQSPPLVALHATIVLWFVVLAAYLGGDRWSPTRRMEAIRFTGEWIIYATLITLGGGVVVGLTVALLAPLAPDAVPEVIAWVLPSGAAATPIVAGWLVESKKSVVENLAPVLTAIFTPLFGAGLVVAVVGYAIAGFGRDFDRELLVVFDVLLVVVVGLVLYGLSARPAGASRGAMDVIRLVTIVAAVVLDVLVLGSMLARVGEYGFTPNRVAALGLNLLLVVDLAGTAILALRRTGLDRATRWQSGFVVALGAWALLVVVALPPLFGFA